MSYAELERFVSHFTDAEINLLRLAYSVAFKAHEGQKRKSGEQYIEHPVAVAYILSQMNMDADSVIAGILHDVIEDSSISSSNLQELFGKNIANLVDGVSKLDKIEFKSKLEIQAENFRKMLLAMSRDIRVIVIKLADRLHNMRTISSVPMTSQKRKALETIDIYAPIARRLGMHQISDELEDLSLKTLYPLRYRVIEKHLQTVKNKHQIWLNDVKNHIQSRLKQHSVDVLWVNVREKQVYSVYNKMKEKKCTFTELTDMYGIRICVGSTDDCYRALGVIHLTYRPFPQRVKDYIASPKPNGYQSLHTVLIGPSGMPIEVQIRTPVMHQMAEQGISAHWLYKSGTELTIEDFNSQQWIQSLLDIHKYTGNSAQFIKELKTDLYTKSVYVFTPKGNIIELKENATVLDFAFEISTDLATHAISARIDHELSPISTPLKNGQTVLILTSNELQISSAWLNIVTTIKAKKYIKNYLKEKENIQYLRVGEKLILQRLSSQFSHADIFQNPAFLLELSQHFEYPSIHELLMDIAHAKHDIDAVCAWINDHIDKQTSKSSIKKLIITGEEGSALTYAKCCMPIYGDNISGLFELEKGLVIHQSTCDLYKKLMSSYKHIDVIWGEIVNKEFITEVHVTATNQRGVLGVIAIAISDAKANIENINLISSDNESAKIIITIGVSGTNHYQAVMRTLKQLRQVLSVKRSFS